MYLRYMTAHVRVNTSITCYAGYFAVHLLRKYTTMLGFLPLANSKILLHKKPSEGFPPEGE